MFSKEEKQIGCTVNEKPSALKFIKITVDNKQREIHLALQNENISFLQSFSVNSVTHGEDQLIVKDGLNFIIAYPNKIIILVSGYGNEHTQIEDVFWDKLNGSRTLTIYTKENAVDTLQELLAS